MKKPRMEEKYVRVVQVRYEGSETVVRCVVGVTEGIISGSTLSSFLFAVVMDRLIDEVRQ